uniref:hypothetical protein n=1 Tax=Cocconeiopsis kantsiensis TaxID=3082010 RepID=UPI003003704C
MNKSNNKDNKNYPNSYGDNLPNESSKDQGNDDISKNSKYLDEFNQFLEFQKEFQIRNDELREQLYDEEQKKRKVIRLASDINKELVRDRYYQLNQQAKRKGKRVAFWRELPGNVKRETKKFIVKLLDPNVFVPLAASLIIYFETNKIARKVEEQDIQIKAIIEQPAFKPAPKRKVATYVIIAGTMAVQLYMQVCTKSELHNTRAQLDQANQILQQTKGESKENSARHSVLIKQKAIQWEKLPNPIFSRLDVVKQTIGHRRLDTTSAYVNKLSDQERQARISQLN